MLKRVLVSVLIVFMIQVVADDNLFEAPFNYYNWSQYNSPNSFSSDWLDEKEFLVHIYVDQQTYDRFLDGQNERDLSDFSGYDVASFKLIKNQLNVNILSGITPSVNYFFRAKALDNQLLISDSFTNLSNQKRINTKGLGDLETGFLLRGIDTKKWKFSMIIGMGFPIGNHKIKANYFSHGENLMGYPLQNSSGSLQLLSGASLKRLYSRYSIGLLAVARTPFLATDESYLHGNELVIDFWGTVSVWKYLTIYSNLEALYQQSVQTVRESLESSLTWAHDPANTGGRYLTSSIGFFGHINWGLFKHYKWFGEYRHPLYQSVNGRQLVSDKQFLIGLRYQFIKSES